MSFKSIVIASSAAILVPGLAVSLFIAIHASQPDSPAGTDKSGPYQGLRKLPINEADGARSFAAPELRLRETEGSTYPGEAKQKAVAIGSWRATAFCAEGQPVREHGNCEQSKNIDVAKDSEVADGEAHARAALTPCVKSKYLARGRQINRQMSLGGPC